jgi:hypothetical protein
MSEAQVKKLLKGQPVRVKHGAHHKVHLSHEQHKKMHKAHAKGAGITLQFDPYQCDAHRHMVGSGFLSKAKALASKAYSGAKKAFAAAPVGLKSAIKSKALEGLKSGLERVAPEIERRFGKIGTEALSSGYDQASQHIQHFGEEPQNEIIGMGVHRRVHHKRGGALKLRDLREGAKKVGRAVSRVGQQIARASAPILGGIAGAEFGPVGSMVGSRLASSLVGSGVKRRGRPRKGGALYTAGYGGSLFPCIEGEVGYGSD